MRSDTDIKTTYLIWILKKSKRETAIIWKRVNCQRITSKILDLDGSTPEPAIRSGDTGQRIPCFDSCQLMTTMTCTQLSPGLPKQLESVRVNIGMPVVRTYGHSVARSLGRSVTGLMGRFIYPWCSAIKDVCNVHGWCMCIIKISRWDFWLVVVY